MTNDTYIHESGVGLRLLGDGCLRIERPGRCTMELDSDEVTAIEDRHLASIGWWLDRETGAIVTTASDSDGDRSCIWPSGNRMYISGDRYSDNLPELDGITARFDAAHPAPRSDPKAGETWIIGRGDAYDTEAQIIETGGVLCAVWNSLTPCIRPVDQLRNLLIRRVES